MEDRKLDLHGVRHHEVRNKVISFIEEYWNKDLEIRIITGNSSKMKQLVIEVIDEYSLNYYEGVLFSGSSNFGIISVWT